LRCNLKSLQFQIVKIVINGIINKIQNKKEAEPIKITIGIANKWLIQRAKRYHWESTIIIYQRNIIIFRYYIILLLST